MTFLVFLTPASCRCPTRRRSRPTAAWRLPRSSSAIPCLAPPATPPPPCPGRSRRWSPPRPSPRTTWRGRGSPPSRCCWRSRRGAGAVGNIKTSIYFPSLEFQLFSHLVNARKLLVVPQIEHLRVGIVAVDEAAHKQQNNGVHSYK